MVLSVEPKILSPLTSAGPKSLNAILTSADLNDIARIIHGLTGDESVYFGPLTARLVELGYHETAEDQQVYIDAMRLQRQRLEQNGSSRRDFALHPRTYGRPSKQLTTDADEWVVTMVENEIDKMSAEDLVILRHHMMMRIGWQHDIHPDFRPLLLQMALNDETLASLASIEKGQRSSQNTSKTFLLAAVAQPFIDVVMIDADDGVELEAAAWGFAQRQMTDVKHPIIEADFITSLRRMSSLLSLIETSRRLAAESSSAQALASLATRSAIAEFILSSLAHLAMKQDTEEERVYHAPISAFVRREPIGRSSSDISKEALETWAKKRTLERLLNDLALVILLASEEGDGLHSLSVSEGDIAAQAHQQLGQIDESPLGRRVTQAIRDGWHFNRWAEAA